MRLVRKGQWGVAVCQEWILYWCPLRPDIAQERKTFRLLIGYRLALVSSSPVRTTRSYRSTRPSENNTAHHRVERTA
jgi:hypothetical protein